MAPTNPSAERQPLITSSGAVSSAPPAPPPPNVFKNSAYWILFVAFLSLNTGYAMVLPSLWPYFRSFGGSKTGYSWAAAAYSFGQAAGALFFGWMSDRYATRWVLTVALVFVVGGAAVYSLAWNEFSIYVARVVWGIGGGCSPVLTAAAARLAPLQQRARAVGIFNLGGTVGYVLGPGFAALTTLMNFPIIPGHYDFDAHTGPGWVTILIAIFITLSIHFTSIPPPARNQQTPEQRAKGRAEVKRRLPLIAAHWLINFTCFTNLAASEVISTPYTFDWYHWGVGTVSVLWLVNSGLGLISYLFVFFFAKNLRATVIVWVSLGFMVVGGLLSVNYPDWHVAVPVPLYLASAVFTSVALTAAISCNIGIMAAIVSPVAHGAAFGINNAVGSVARATAPLWSVPIYASLGPTAINMCMTVVIIIAFTTQGFLWKTEGQILDNLRRPRVPSVSPPRRLVNEPEEPDVNADETSDDDLEVASRRQAAAASIQDGLPVGARSVQGQGL